VADGGNKTEEATPQQLRKARQRGDSGASSVASQSVSFVVALVAAPAALGALALHGAFHLRQAIVRAADLSLAGSASVDVRDLGPPLPWALEWLALVTPLLVAVAAAGAFVQLVQTGGAVATARITPDFGRLNPFAGLSGLLSWTRVFSVVRALVSAALSAWLAYAMLRGHGADLAHTTGRIGGAAVLAPAIAVGLGWRIGALGLLLGLLDILVTRGAWKRRLRMTPDEVKRERRDAEGDPETKAARSRAHQEVVAQATIANVRHATVVVVNPTHLACALRYDEPGGDLAPVVVASGEGDFAAQIVRAARDYSVPVLQNVPLARALVELRVGDTIPEALYEAVAEILGVIART
jgi:flagellar biosynthesis protein FlhB